MYWLISANPKVYDHFGAFYDNGLIDWRMNNTKYSVGDYVYIYTTTPYKRIMFKCLVTKINIPFSEMITDWNYWKVKQGARSARIFARFVLLTTFDDNMMSYAQLLQNGLNGPIQGPLRLSNKPQLLAYINNVEQNCKPISKFFSRTTQQAVQRMFEKVTRTDRETLIKQRIGQDVFRNELLIKHGDKCQLCGIEGAGLLTASHIKPWSESNPDERLDTDNGLLLCPNHDRLFDKHIISFTADGDIMIHESLSVANQELLNIHPSMSIPPSVFNETYMSYHRSKFFEMD